MSPEKPWRSEERLVELFYGEGLSQREISERFGCSHSTVGRWMREFDISPDRDHDTGDKDAPWRDEKTLKKLYHGEKLSEEKIADRLGCGSSTVGVWLRRHGIERRHPNDRSHKPPGCRTDKDGYVRWMLQDGDSNVSVSVHRLLAVAEYGVEEVAGNVVHHENEIPWDNRPSNLEVMSSSEHTSYHHTGRDVSSRSRDENGRFTNEE